MVNRRFVIEESGLPSLPGMMVATFEALKAIGGSATIQELDEKVAELEGVTEAEQTFTMSATDQRPRLNYYLAWARTYLRRGDMIVNSARGVWAIAPNAPAALTITDTDAIFQRVQAEERERAKAKRDARGSRTGTAAVQTREDEPEEDWNDLLLGVLRAMEPSAFERLCQRLLREAGFTKVEVRGKSGDGGIDGVGVLRVNLVSFQVFFQCKRYTGAVSASEIRDFRGAMQGRADKGLFITTGRFTAQANDEATRDGATAIDLIDGPRLCDLLKENGLGVSTRTVEEVSIDSSFFGSL